MWRCGPTWAIASSFFRFLDHTQWHITVGRTPPDAWSVRRRDLYLTTHNTHTRQTSMPQAGCEPTISAGERLQTYTSDPAATGTGNLSFNGQIIAQTFHKYFVWLAQNINVNNHNANKRSNHDNSLSYLSRAFNQPFPTTNPKCVSSKEIENLTKSLKIKKNSHGYNGILTKILKLSIQYISSPQPYICNRILSSGIFPTRLRISEVKPIFKKREKICLISVHINFKYFW